MSQPPQPPQTGQPGQSQQPGQPQQPPQAGRAGQTPRPGQPGQMQGTPASQQPGTTAGPGGMGQQATGGQQPAMGSQQATGPQQPGPAAGGPTGRLFPTRNYLAEDVRVSTVGLLNQLLADTTDLRTQVKAAHWNVKGSNFFALHELFDEIAEHLETHADEIAERATALGGEALGTARTAASVSRIPELPAGPVTGSEYVELVAERMAIHDADLGEAMRVASGQDDLDTTDLLNEVSRQVSKDLWFLEAHLQTAPLPGPWSAPAQQPARPTGQETQPRTPPGQGQQQPGQGYGGQQPGQQYAGGGQPGQQYAGGGQPGQHAGGQQGQPGQQTTGSW